MFVALMLVFKACVIWHATSPVLYWGKKWQISTGFWNGGFSLEL